MAEISVEFHCTGMVDPLRQTAICDLLHNLSDEGVRNLFAEIDRRGTDVGDAIFNDHIKKIAGRVRIMKQGKKSKLYLLFFCFFWGGGGRIFKPS